MSIAIMTQMVTRCLTMDNHATRLYLNLAHQAADGSLKSFWQDIAEKNGRHVNYWGLLLEWTQKGMLDTLFDDAQKTLAELDRLERKIHDLVDGCVQVGRKRKAFAMAFKLEFYLLHPCFETLSQYAATFNGGAGSECFYARFVNVLFDALQQNELSILELELVGEVIHRLWKENRWMAFLSNYDELTGVFNRRGLFSAINHLAHLAQRNQNTVGGLMIDIDHFKSVNDNYGHPFGDEMLRRVAGTVRQSIRASDEIFN